MPSKYKLSQLAQAHLQKIKAYTVENHSEQQWQAYMLLGSIFAIHMNLVSINTTAFLSIAALSLLTPHP